MIDVYRASIDSAEAFNAWLLSEEPKAPLQACDQLGRDAANKLELDINPEMSAIMALITFIRSRDKDDPLFPIFSRMDENPGGDGLHDEKATQVADRFDQDPVAYWSLYLWQRTMSNTKAFAAIAQPCPKEVLSRSQLITPVQKLSPVLPSLTIVHLDSHEFVTVIERGIEYRKSL